jgi:hypothetical protein
VWKSTDTWQFLFFSPPSGSKNHPPPFKERKVVGWCCGCCSGEWSLSCWGRLKKEIKEEEDFFFGILCCCCFVYFALSLAAACAATRSVEQRVTSLWRHLEMRSRWWREKKTFTYRQKEPPGYTHTVCILLYYLSLSLSLFFCAFVMDGGCAVLGVVCWCCCCCWMAEDIFPPLSDWLHTHSLRIEKREKEHTHQSAVGSVKAFW